MTGDGLRGPGSAEHRVRFRKGVIPSRDLQISPRVDYDDN